MDTIINNPELFIIRVGNGRNFKNSVNPFWGVKRGAGGGIKTIVEKIPIGAILCFFTSKEYGGNIIGMAEYTGLYDRSDEPIHPFYTCTCDAQGWVGEDDWALQLHYTNLYNTERQQIKICLQWGGIIGEYKTFRDRIADDLYLHYRNFVFYSSPIRRIG